MKRNYVDVREGDIPGVVLRDGVAYYPMAGQMFRVTALVWSNGKGQYVPILDIPMLDEKPKAAETA